MKRLIFLTAILLPLFLLTSCVPDVPDTPIYPDPPAVIEGDMDGFIEGKIQEMTQNFTVDASTGGSIFGAQGTEVCFSPNSFVDANGNAITGSVDVALLEIYDKASMMFTNKQTIADVSGNSEIIVSRGEFGVTLSQNGQQVFLNWVGCLKTRPSTAPFNFDMRKFDGTVDAATGDITWALAPDSIPVFDSTTTNWTDSYMFYSPFNDSTNWINCDYFWNNNNTRVDFPIELPAKYTRENSRVWASVNGVNSVLTLYNNFNMPVNVFFGNSVPENTDLNVVIIHDNEGDLSYAVVPVSVTPSTDIKVDEADFTEGTEAEIETVINGLP